MSERLEAGSIVDARYRIDHRLGAGGMAEVYCAEDLQLGRKVALKVLYRRFAEDEEFVERFRREASSAAGLQHQHVVAVYDRGEFDGTYYIAMEYLDGRSLKNIIQDEAPLEPGRAIDLITQILGAARFAHRRGIIHRDLKPHNVIVDDEDRAKVTDFGIARAGASDMTQTGSIMGTAQYLSPEQAQGLPVSERSDLYSIGIMLYEMLTGRLPFVGESAVSIALKHVSELPERPSTYNPEIGVGLEAVVLRSLAKDPDQRFPDADEFIAALEAARAGDPNAAGLVASDTTHFVGRTGAPLATPAEGAAVYESGVHPVAAPPLEEGDGEGRWWLWLVALAVVAGLVVAGVLVFGGAGKTYPVPSVVGTHDVAAQLALRNQGFSTDTQPSPSATALVGIVISQDPPAGTRIEKGATVHLIVSSGPARATVPPVSGLGRKAATNVLKAAGFAHVKESFTFSTLFATNHVIRASPEEGSTQDTTFPITLIVSRGKEQVKVPDESGKPQADAILDLKNAGLRYGITQQPSSKPAGTVVTQSPAPGTKVPKSTVVTLTIAVGVAIPDVVGATQLTAKNQLTAAGLTPSVDTVIVHDPGKNLRVQSQNPASGGNPVPKGTTVTITVGQYKGGGTPTTPTTPTTPVVPTTTTPTPP